MHSKYRKFCPKKDSCDENCEDCMETSKMLGHEINKNYLESIGKKCMCSECRDV